MSIQCEVYKSSRKPGLYLYVNQQEGLARVPEALLAQCGELSVALNFDLHATRRMARQDPVLVMKNIEAQGYHLQLPPANTYATLEQPV